MAKISCTRISGVPVFITDSVAPGYERVYGARLNKKEGRYEFPAYPPVGLTVLGDLQKTAPDAQLDELADAQVAKLHAAHQAHREREIPAEPAFHTPPFDHQKEGLSDMLHRWRHALFWEAGTGKSKVVVDYHRHVGGRMLILCPPVVQGSWAQQFKTHGSTARVQILEGTQAKKLKIIRDPGSYDVLLATYTGLATLAFPRAYQATWDAVVDARKAGRVIADSTRDTLLRAAWKFSEPQMQLNFVLAWAFGMPVTQITEYAADIARSLPPQWLCDVPFDTIVADESHNLATHNSTKTKQAIKLAMKVPRRYILTGTLSKGDPGHVYGQMKFLGGGVIPEDWPEFENRYMVKSTWNKHMVVGYQNLDVLNARIARVASFKVKSECITLPPRLVVDVPVELAASQVKVYNTLVEELEVALGDTFDEGGLVQVQNAAILINKLAQISGGFITESMRNTALCDNCPRVARCVEENIQPYTKRCAVEQRPPPGLVKRFPDNPKLEALENILTPLMESERPAKVIIWAMYLEELSIIEEWLQEQKWGYVRMDGSVKDRQERVDRFNTEPACKVYLGQVQTGVGITLNAATYMVYYALPWSLTDYLQSLDRNFRVGQTEKTTVYRLIGEGSVDVFKVAALEAKEDVSRTLTKRVTCVTCEHQSRCMRDGVTVYGKGCVYVRGMRRVVAKARTIKEGSDE